MIVFRFSPLLEFIFWKGVFKGGSRIFLKKYLSWGCKSVGIGSGGNVRNMFSIMPQDVMESSISPQRIVSRSADFRTGSQPHGGYRKS